MILEIIGWIGTVLYLFNHAYLSLYAHWQKKIYYSGNLIAALCLVVSSLYISSYQAVVVNSFWALISIALLCHLPIAKLPASRRIFYSCLLIFFALLIFYFVADGLLRMDVLGWSASFAFSFAYLLFSSDKISKLQYLLWNTYAALALIPTLWLDQNIPVLALEIIWALLSFYGALRRYKNVHLID